MIWQMKWLCIIRRLKNGQKKNEKEHVDNDRAVRKMLLDRGIVPENLPASEDVKKVERRLKKTVDVKKVQKRWT